MNMFCMYPMSLTWPLNEVWRFGILRIFPETLVPEHKHTISFRNSTLACNTQRLQNVIVLVIGVKVQISFILCKSSANVATFGYERSQQQSSSGQQEGEMLFLRNQWQGLVSQIAEICFPPKWILYIERCDIMSKKQSLTITQWHLASLPRWGWHVEREKILTFCPHYL